MITPAAVHNSDWFLLLGATTVAIGIVQLLLMILGAWQRRSLATAGHLSLATAPMLVAWMACTGQIQHGTEATPTLLGVSYFLRMGLLCSTTLTVTGSIAMLVTNYPHSRWSVGRSALLVPGLLGSAALVWPYPAAVGALGVCAIVATVLALRTADDVDDVNWMSRQQVSAVGMLALAASLLLAAHQISIQDQLYKTEAALAASTLSQPLLLTPAWLPAFLPPALPVPALTLLLALILHGNAISNKRAFVGFAFIAAVVGVHLGLAGQALWAAIQADLI